jgi:methylated-DNA-[protein]-cysteine S-methyltransferase
LANAVDKNQRLTLFATTPDEGEAWVGRHGCRVTVRGGRVVETLLLDGAPLFHGSAKATPALQSALNEIGEYLSGKRRYFSVPIFMEGPPFYRKVWEALRQVPYGKTLSYGELAILAGSPGGARAVGSAMAKNPLVLLVPCHRVVGSGGKLGGFSCGTAWKKFLLELEGRSATLEFKA